MPQANGAFRTDDLALATTLALAGHPYKLEKLTQKKAIWIFAAKEGCEDAFDDLIDEYNEFLAQVEPRSFILRLAEMRRELFELVPRRPVAPAPAR